MPPTRAPEQPRVPLLDTEQEAILLRFEESWERGEAPEVRSFWQAGGSAALLAELIHVDLERRIKAGKPWGIEEYLQLFPTLRDNEPALKGLVQAEIELHRDAGRRTTLVALSTESSAARSTPPGDACVTQNPALSPGNDLLAGRARLGRYRILKLLGKGGMGAVFLAEDEQLQRKVAIKVPQFSPLADPDLRQRFLTEARAAANLRHANICPVYDVGESDGLLYLTMGHIDGVTLLEQVRRQGPMAPRRAAGLVRQLALALSEAHQQKIIHRDLKPSNVMLDSKGEPVLMDFGLARRTDLEHGHITSEGRVMGTPAYMAPEQAEGHVSEIGPATDVYGLGAILYELLTGRPPFQGGVARVLAQVIDTPPEPPSRACAGLDPRLEAICFKALAKKPGERFAGAREFADALATVVGQTFLSADATMDWDACSTHASNPVGTQATTLPPRSHAVLAPPRRRRLLLSAAALLFVAALIATVVIMVRTPRGTLIIESDDPDAEFIVKGEGVVIRIKDGERSLTVGDYTTEVADAKNGFKLNTERFTIPRNGKDAIRVQLEKTPAGISVDAKKGAKDARDPERQVAEWVLAVGGRVRVKVADRDSDYLTRVEQLPIGPFVVRGIDLRLRKDVNDADVERLKVLKDLEGLDLGATNTTDQGLRSLKGHSALRFLTLNGTKVTGSGLENLTGIPLHELDLNDLPIEDRDLAHLAGMTQMRRLFLILTRISDAGVVHLKGMKDLQHLGLNGTRITGSGLKHLWRKERIRIDLDYTLIDDTTIAYLKGFPGLWELEVRNTQLTNACIEDLTHLKNLGVLRVSGSKITPAGVRKLKSALPKCSVDMPAEKDADKDAAAADLDRRAAEWVLEKGGGVKVRSLDEGDRHIPTKKELPDGLFRLVFIDLRGKKLADDDLAQLNGLQHLEVLDLNGTPVSDAGLAHLTSLRNLERLSLPETNVTDNGMAHLASLTNLVHLSLNVTKVADAGLAHFKKLKKLRSLELHATQVRDAGLVHLKELTDLQVLWLSNTRVTGAGLEHLRDGPQLRVLTLGKTAAGPGLSQIKALPKLEILDLSDCSVSNDDLEHLLHLRGLSNLNLSGSAVTDAGLKRLTALPGLTMLVVQRTSVTAPAVAQFKAALPKCQVNWDGK